MPRPGLVSMKLTYDQVKVLDMLIALAISQWPIDMIDVDVDLLTLHSKVMLARDEFER